MSGEEQKQSSKGVSRRRALLKRELGRWLPLLLSHQQPEKIILFGSYPAGQVGEWSDLDMVIIRETEAPFLERVRSVLALLEPKVGLDVLVYTPKEFAVLSQERPFVRDEVIAKGEVIYERSG